MEYLIDSDVFIDYLQMDHAATALVEGLVPAGIAISIITYMESFEGTFRTRDPLVSQRQFAELLAGVPVLPFSVVTARLCAEVRHELSAGGKRVRSRALDLIIAATALEHNLVVVTRNRSDYQDIPELRIA